MSNEEMPANVLRAMEIIQNAKSEDGWVSEEEHNRICVELGKLGITVVADSAGDEGGPPATNKQALVEDVQIHPWAKTDDGKLFNPWCSDEEGEDAGWNVHSFASDGQGSGEIIDDDDFGDYQSALAHGEALARKYGAPLRHRTLFMIG